MRNNKSINSQITALEQNIGSQPSTLTLDQEIRATGKRIRRKILDMDMFVELNAEFRTEADLKDGIPLERIDTDGHNTCAYPYITHSIDYSLCRNAGIRDAAEMLLQQCRKIRSIEGMTYTEYIQKGIEETRRRTQHKVGTQTAEG